jgi:hypothetical protein
MLSTYSALLLFRVGVVEAEVAFRADGGVFQGDAEVQADRLGVADVQVAVGLRRKTGDGGGVFAGGQVIGDDLADEVGFGAGYRTWGHGKRNTSRRKDAIGPGNKTYSSHFFILCLELEAVLPSR